MSISQFASRRLTSMAIVAMVVVIAICVVRGQAPLPSESVASPTVISMAQLIDASRSNSISTVRQNGRVLAVGFLEGTPFQIDLGSVPGASFTIHNGRLLLLRPKWNEIGNDLVIREITTGRELITHVFDVATAAWKPDGEAIAVIFHDGTHYGLAVCTSTLSDPTIIATNVHGHALPLEDVDVRIIYFLSTLAGPPSKPKNPILSW